MIDLAVLKSTFKRPRVFLSVAGALLFLIIWALAYFLPQGSKVTSLKAQEATLQSQVAQGNAKVLKLRHTYQHATQIKAEESKLNSAVPATSDAYNYVQALSSAAAAAGVHLTSIEISAGTSPSTTSTSGGKKSSTVSVSPIPLALMAKGTYDQILSLIAAIYQLPRLTDINELSINGGGPKADRSTVLTVNLTLSAFSYGIAQSNS